MRVTTLRLSSFRSYVGVDLDVDAPRVLICGVNGSGKSSIREAIRWTLTGRCQGTDAKGSGAEHLVPFGLDAVTAEVDLTPVGRVGRVRRNGSHTLAVAEFTGDLTTLQRGLYEALNTSPAFLDVVLETENFLQLHHADAKGLILSLLDVRVPTEQWGLLPLDELDQRYKEAFDARRVAKAKLRDFAIPPAPDSETPLPPLEAIDAHLEKLREELAARRVADAGVAGQRQALVARREALLRKGLIDADAVSLAPRETLPKAIEQATKAVNDAETVIDLDGSIATSTHRLIAVLQAHRPTKGCVLDPEVPCETSKHKFNHRVKRLQADLAARGEVAVQVPVPPDLAGLRSRLASLQAAQRAYEDADRINEERTRELADLEAQIAALPDPPPDDPEADTLRARIDKGKLVRSRAETYWTAHRARQAAIGKREALEAEVARLEGLVDLLGPNGARVPALAAALEPFQTSINRLTERFGWTVSFTVEPWRVVINGRPVETYSESEQFRIGIAIQLAVAELSGLSFAVIDRLDMLDLANRNAVATMVLESPLEQVILLTTREPTQPLPGNVKAHRLALRQGRTAVIETGAPA